MPWELAPYQEFSVGFCFLRIRHSVGAVARLELLRAQMSMMLRPSEFHLCLHGYFTLGFIQKVLGFLGQEVDQHPKSM